MPILAISHLAISFVQYDVGLTRRIVSPVTDMTFHVEQREVVAVIGESGAGKSLVGLATMGLLPPNAQESGSIRLRGEPIDAQARRRLAGSTLSLLPQSDSYLDPTARIGRQVTRIAELADIDRPERVARAALDRRGLDDVWKQYPHQLSGGMARRVLFAMATLRNPEVIFADEPTPGLHPASAAEVLADIRALADQGAAVILVSHDIDRAVTVADRVVICQAGRTIEEASIDQLANDGAGLHQPYSRTLLRALPAHGFESVGEP